MKIKAAAISIIIVLSGVIVKHVRDYKYQRFVDAVGMYQSKVELKTTRPFSIDTTTFQINEYMAIFDRLTIEEGYYPDYYYFDTYLEGEPKLITLKEGTLLTNLVEEYSNKAQVNPDSVIDRLETNLISMDFYNHLQYELNPRDHILPDHSKYGYFQLLMFDLIAENFGLVWHSGYKNVDIICTKALLLSHFRNIKANSTYHEFSQEERAKVKRINPSPKFKIRNDTCYVKILVFNEWEGYSRKTFPISTKYPYQVGNPYVEVLAKYTSDIIF